MSTTDIEPAATESEPATDIMATPGNLVIGGTFAIYTAGGGQLALIADIEGQGRVEKLVPKMLVDAFQGKGPMGKMVQKLFAGLGA